MPSTPLTHDELSQHLREQLGFLDESARQYDQGKEHEAKRLATTIRVLVHDTTQSHSLLQQLGVKGQIPYWSVLLQEAGPACRSFMGIGMQIAFGGEDRYVSNLFPPQRQLPFDKWWDDGPLIVQDMERLTRRRVVLALANRDGGAHVDPTLNDLDRRVLRSDLMGWQMINVTGGRPTIVQEKNLSLGDQEVVVRITNLEGATTTELPSDLTSPAGAAVRQVAHELCGTIREHLGHLLG